MSTEMHAAHEMIREYVQDIEWDDPFWLEDVQDQFPTLSTHEIERIYAEQLRLKLQSWSADELERQYQEQMDLSPGTRNYVMVEVLEGLLSSTEAG